MLRIMKEKNWLKSFSLTVLLLLCATAGQADDTEIYYKSTSGGGNVNLMFLLDTSGSMAWCSGSSSCGDDSKVRMNILKNVFSQLVDGMGSNINVGLAAFSGSGNSQVGGGNTGNGGYVLYPIRNLDAAAVGLVADSSVSRAADDGYEAFGSTQATYGSSGIDFPSNSATGTATGLIFRNLQLPRYATITKATLTVDAMETSYTDLDMLGYYSVGADMPDLSQQDMNSRTWGPMIGTTPVLTGVPVSVTSTWKKGKNQDIDVTSLVSRFVNDSSWCGGDDVLLGFMNRSTTDSSAVQIGTVETMGDNGNGYTPASLHVEWEVNSNLLLGTKSCNGGMARGLGNNTDDAEQGTDGTVDTGGKTITLADSTLGGFRFPGLRFSGSDTIDEAILHLPGAGSQANIPVCWYYSSSDYRGNPSWLGKVSSLNSPAPASNFQCGNDITQTTQQTVCTQTDQWGGCTKTTVQNVSTTYHTGVQDNPASLPASTPLTLHVAVVQGDAAAITGSDNDISGRTVLASMDKSITAAAFNGIIDVDVTSLAQQAMSSANGWASNDALMFIVSVTGVTVPTGYTDPEFYINAQDNSGVAASITFKVESPIQTEFTPLVRDQLKAAVNGLVPNGGTPLSESYTEVARYLMGSSTYFGNGGSGHAISAPQSTVDEAGNTYSSPIAAANQSCAANSIIVMTDGVSNSDTETPTQTKSVTNSKVSCSSISDSGNSLNPDDYTCMAKLSGWLNVADKNTVNRQITTNMVGFYLDSSTLKQMQKVSDAGQGTTFAADDATSLLAAFQKIVSSVVDTNATMAAPGVAVNQLNRLQYLNQLYYAVFKPKNIGVWPGNLKKYALGGTAENPVVEDVNGKTATDPNTGFFLNTAKSYWSQEVDGQNVNAGGAKEVLDNSTVGRHLYVTTATGGIHGADPADRTVASTSLTKVTTWDAIPGEDLVPAGYTPALTDDQRKDVMDWLDTSWGDPLHSEPQLVNYGYTGGDYVAAANDPSLQKNAVFYSDNDGILHVVNAYNGKELMAFTPIEELHKAANRLNIEQQNPGAPVLSAPDYHRTTYGLDGTWVFWRRANTSDPSTVSSVYAYAGQRRGGRNYYALDVTSLDFSGAGNNTQNPSLLWQISPSSAAPFSLLGQTWSTPQLTKVSVNGKDVPVLVFAGGYDEAQDNNTVSSGDSMGNAIYMVNAFTGALVWYASNGAQLGTGSYGYSQNADMKWSMPAPPTVVDADGDGYADFIYAADMHGQVFRVDLDNFNNTGASGLVKDVVTLAKLGAGTTTNAADNRRFFAAPAVALSKRGDNTLLQVVIGSGYRAHPLAETTQEFVYGLDDVEALPTLQAIKNKQTVPGTTTLTSSDLADVTDPTASVTIDDVDTFGWKLGLDQSVGEKALSEAVILNNMAVFTTFTNESTQIDSCTSVAGGARLYIVNLGDGLTPDGMTSRSQSINVPGIPPAAQVLLTDLPSASDDGSDSDGGSGSGGDDESNSACGFQGSNMTALIGAMAVNLGQFNQCGLQRTGWYESTPTQVKQIFDNEGAVESTGDSQSP